MLIDRLQFLNYLDLLSLKGLISNDQVLINISKDNIKSITCSRDKSTIVRGTLKGEYANDASFAIPDLSYMRKVLALHNDSQVEFQVVDNKLMITDSELESESILTEEEYIKNTFDESKFEKYQSGFTGDTVHLNAEHIAKILKCFQLNASEKREENYLTFALNKNKLTVKFKGAGENSLKYTFELTKEYPKTTFKMGQSFVEALESIKTSVPLQVNDNGVYMQLQNGDLTFEYIVASAL